MKTLQDLIDHFANEPEIQAKVTANAIHNPDGISLRSVLLGSFVFLATPEGGDYWWEVFGQLPEA